MKAYLIRLTAAAILAAVVRRMAPDSGAGKASRLGAGLLVVITALGPLGEMDLVAAAENLMVSGYSDVLTSQPVDRASNSLLTELIIESTETYILDKAQALGAEVTAQVETKLEDRYPVPWSVKLTGNVTQEQKAQLQRIIAEELGIPEDRQEW